VQHKVDKTIGSTFPHVSVKPLTIIVSSTNVEIVGKHKYAPYAAETQVYLH